MKITIGIRPGHGKTESEDISFFNSHVQTGGFTAAPEEEVNCLGLCDGVGGNAGGRTASEFIAARFAAGDFSRMREPELADFVRELNHALLRHSADCPGQENMAATLSCIVRSREGYCLIHAGNTRIYALQGSYLKQLTEDHTHRARLLRSGQAEAAAQCPGNRIYCALGGGNPEFARSLTIRKLEYPILPDCLLLTSDGIHDHLSPDEMEDILSSGGPDAEIITRLMTAAREKGSSDDMTILIART